LSRGPPAEDELGDDGSWVELDGSLLAVAVVGEAAAGFGFEAVFGAYLEGGGVEH